MLNDPGGRAPAPGRSRLVQRFVNTVDFENGIEELTDPAALEQALDEIGVPAGVGLGSADLERALRVREALRALLLGNNGIEIERSTLAALEETARRGRLTVEFDEDGRAELLTPGLPVSTAHSAASSGSSTPPWRTAHGRDSRPVRDTSAGGCSTTARRTATAAGARCPSAGIASRPRNTGGERRRLPQPRVAAPWPRRSRIPRSRTCSSSAPRIRSERVFLEDVARRGLGRFDAVEESGRLTAVCHIGANVVPSGAGCSVFGRAAARGKPRMIIGDERAVDELWEVARHRMSRPRADRPGQPVYVIEEPPPPGGTGLRAATARDLELLVPACARTHLEEIE